MTDTPRVKLPELLPCPFCEAPAEFDRGGFGEIFVACTKCWCHMGGAWSIDYQRAANGWNTRAAVAGNAVAGLVEVFRERAKNASYSDEADQAYKDCADELEAALQGDSDDGR